MSIETNLRAGLEDLAGDARPVPGLAAAALRRGRRRRTVARGVLTAGAVAAAAVPVGMVWLGDDEPGGLAPAGSDIVPAPEWRELTGDELVAAVDACFAGTPAHALDSVRGIQLIEQESPALPPTWLVTQNAYAGWTQCTLPAGWDPPRQLVGPSADGAELVADHGLGTGTYTDPVTRVTVQYEGGPEAEAVVWDGFWFDPLDFARLAAEYDVCDGPLPYVLRGYDEAGELVSETAYDDAFTALRHGEKLAEVSRTVCEP